MAKPLNENLKAVRVETDEGDLLPIMDVAGTKFSELINAVTAHNKAGHADAEDRDQAIDSRDARRQG
ncbi:MAG: hypothetical protein PHD19_09515 [Dechloromonas sp.]|nr:hypothetical protein [Dechloromonas sp.]